MRFGHVKVLAHRALNGECIPFFAERRPNLDIEDHCDRILARRTRRRKWEARRGRHRR